MLFYFSIHNALEEVLYDAQVISLSNASIAQCIHSNVHTSEQQIEAHCGDSSLTHRLAVICKAVLESEYKTRPF